MGMRLGWTAWPGGGRSEGEHSIPSTRVAEHRAKGQRCLLHDACVPAAPVRLQHPPPRVQKAPRNGQGGTVPPMAPQLTRSPAATSLSCWRSFLRGAEMR